MITINVAGTKELMEDLRKANIEVKEEAFHVLREMAIKIRDMAKQRVRVQKPRGKNGIAPKTAGTLRESIRYSVSRKKLTGRVYAGGKVKGADAYYAYFIEYGTRKMKNGPYPFIKPSGRYYENEIQQNLSKVMFEALKKGVE